MTRRRPSAQWHIYRSVYCPRCEIEHPTALARFRNGGWEIDCPNCGVLPWRARFSVQLAGCCAQLRSDAMSSARIPAVIELLQRVA